MPLFIEINQQFLIVNERLSQILDLFRLLNNYLVHPMGELFGSNFKLLSHKGNYPFILLFHLFTFFALIWSRFIFLVIYLLFFLVFSRWFKGRIALRYVLSFFWNVLSVSELVSKFIFVPDWFRGHCEEIISSLKFIQFFSVVNVICRFWNHNVVLICWFMGFVRSIILVGKCREWIGLNAITLCEIGFLVKVIVNIVAFVFH